MKTIPENIWRLADAPPTFVQLSPAELEEKDAQNRIESRLVAARLDAAIHFPNALLPGRWPALIERHRANLCFCEKCEGLRTDGITWVGHDDLCSCHTRSEWWCETCDGTSPVTACDCALSRLRVSPARRSSRLLPGALAGFLARLEIALWCRSRLWLKAGGFATRLVRTNCPDWVPPEQLPHPCFGGCVHTDGVRSESDACRSCVERVVSLKWHRSIR